MRRSTQKITFLLLLAPCHLPAMELPWADSVLVDKSEKRLYLIKAGKPFREYRIAMGANARGHKRREGDKRTPEGIYTLDWRNPNSRFYKSIHISYPNEQDHRAAAARHEDPGGMIMIHGLPTDLDWAETYFSNRDWTTGCIAVTNREMDEIWLAVRNGTPIEIVP